MDNLPSTTPSPTTPPSAPVAPPQQAATGSMAKEVAPIKTAPEVPVVTEVGKEVTLSPEVASAGVRMQSDTVVLPKPLQDLGVTAVGPTTKAPAHAPAIVLPLNDDQIATGLHQSLMTSWRWLAEWCNRQLHAVHLTLKTVHGKIVRAEA